MGKRSKGNPRNRHGEWALEEGHGQHQAAKTTRQQNEAKQKQKLKATSEEINKRKQTLGMRKQKPTVNRNATENKWLLHNSRNKTIIG